MPGLGEVMVRITDKYLNALATTAMYALRKIGGQSATATNYTRRINTNEIKIYIERIEAKDVIRKDETTDGVYYKRKTKTIHTLDVEGHEEFFHIFWTRIVSAKVAPGPREARSAHAVKRLSTGPCLWITTVQCGSPFLW